MGLVYQDKRYGCWGVCQVQTQVEHSTGKKIKNIKNDNGNEYMLTKFEIILKVKEFIMRELNRTPYKAMLLQIENISLFKTTHFCVCKAPFFKHHGQRLSSWHVSCEAND